MIKCIGCLIYDVEKDMFLLQQRSKKSSYSYKWGMWGGKLNKNEDFGPALKRELEEELSSVPDYIKLYPLNVYLSDDNHFIYYSFIMIVEKFNDIKIKESETNDFIWIPLKYIERLDLHPGLKKTMEEKKDVIEHAIQNHKRH